MSKNNDAPQRLERALQQTEADADASLKSLQAASRALKRLRSVVNEGNLREVRSAVAAAEQTVDALSGRLPKP